MSGDAPYVTPQFGLKAFNCPHCRAYASQSWLHISDRIPTNDLFENEARRYFFSRCSHCKGVGNWFDGAMLVPEVSIAPAPHVDLPDCLRADFAEAASILQKSPRSAAALLRLCVQKLCKELGEPGENINADIASLVAKGLPVAVQQALDIVRVVGNEQVHPGVLDVRDDPSVAIELFNLINFVVDDRISRPKAIADLYSRLPKNKLEGIAARDKKIVT